MNRDPEQKEFLFTQSEFERIRTLLYQHSGIKLNDSKKDMVYSRLGRRLRATGLKSFQEYLALVEQDQGDEWEAFLIRLLPISLHFSVNHIIFLYSGSMC